VKDKFLKLTGPVALAVVLALTVLYVCNVQILPTEEPVARSYGCAVYTEQGCTKYIVADGGEVEIQSGGTLDVQSGATFNIDSLYPIGYASSGQQLVYGTSSITGTATADHGLTTVTWALCTLGEDPTSGAGDAAMCTVEVSANVVTVKVWQDDFVTAATETDVVVHWLVVGTP
jgi:hypothetical protein